MNPWIPRIIVTILAIAFLPLVVNGVATLIANGIDAVNHGINGLLAPLGMSGHARVHGVMKICLYIVSITLLIRFLFDNWNRK
jgi:hypothetical protein